MKKFLQCDNLLDNIIKVIFFILSIVGLAVTLVYIFYTSTAILTSDSVITDVIAHLQVMDKQFILSNWYYGNEFWLFSLTIPTVILSFIIKNNLLLRQISVLITAILFFSLLYTYGKKFIGKKEAIILVIIFLTGISYSILDYFYCFNAYLTVTINSMFLLYLYYKSFIEKNSKKIYFILALIVTFLVNMGSLRYLPSVTVSFLITELILIIINNKNKDIKKIVSSNITTIIKLILVFLVAFLSFVTFCIIISTYHYEARASSMIMNQLSGKHITKALEAIISCINNFFGYDNKNHYYVYLMGNQYFLPNHRNYSFLSFFTFTNVIKILVCILCLVISPIILYKNYKKNDSKINFLLIFNTVSWFFMIYLYVFTNTFFYHYLELKYFIFNIIISIIISIYAIYRYIASTHIKKWIIDIFIITYIISNLYTTMLTIKDNDKKVIEEKYQLVNLLKEHNLTFGYGGFWTGLLTHYLSDYKITVASMTFYGEVIPYKWYADKRWYSTKYTGRIFVVLDKKEARFFNKYKNKYPSPDDILQCKGFVVYIYNKNPFLETLVDYGE